MKNQFLVMAAVVVLIVGTGSFFGGMKYQQSNATGGFNRMGQFQGNRQGMIGAQSQSRFGNMGGAVIGEIINQDDKSITVKLQDGSTKLVLLSDSVTVSKTDNGSKEDVKTGEKVAVFGASNSDGTLTAQNIQLNPAFRMGQGVRGQASPSSSPR